MPRAVGLVSLAALSCGVGWGLGGWGLWGLGRWGGWGGGLGGGCRDRQPEASADYVTYCK